MQYAVAIAAIIVAAAALFGWGRLVRRATGLTLGGWPLTIGFGLGAVIFLGGLCNLFHGARPWAFDTIVALGLGIAAVDWRRHPPAPLAWWRESGAAKWSTLLLAAIILAVGGFVLVTQLVPVAFNFADDFEKYIPEVARMLATGTVHDNPLGSIGIETPGGQAVLQGFIAAHFPLDYINGADALFCLLLSLAILGGAIRGHPRRGPAMVAGALALLAVDPHYANVSGLYSIAALALATLFASLDAPEPGTVKPRMRVEAAVGLLYAAQIAVKATALSFIGLHFLFWIGATALLGRDWRFALRRGAMTALWSLVFLSPWLALWAPDYVAILAPPPGSPVLPPPPAHMPAFVDPFTTEMFIPYAWYSTTAILVLCYGAAVLIRARRLAEPSARLRAAAFVAFCAAAAGNYAFCIGYVGPYLLDLGGATRYAAPWLAAGIGAALALGPACLSDGGEAAPSRIPVWASVLAGVAVIVMFGPSFEQRVSYSALYKMPQSYLRRWSQQQMEGAAEATADAFHGKLRADVETAQIQVPAGEPLLVWMQTPFLLDYRRNPIHEIGWYQLVRPWTLIPKTNYVLWQYDGYGVRTPEFYAYEIRTNAAFTAGAAIGALQFGAQLQKIINRSQIVYENNGIVVARIDCPKGVALC